MLAIKLERFTGFNDGRPKWCSLRKLARPSQGDSLNAQQHLPPHGCKHFDSAIGNPAEYDPRSIGLSQSIRDLCSLFVVVKHIPKSRPSDQQLKQYDANAFHGRILADV